MKIISFNLFGLFLAIFLSRFATKHLINKLSNKIEIPKPFNVNLELWNEIIGENQGEHFSDKQGAYGSRLLGIVEMVLFFISFSFNIPQLILALLTFKLVSKWDAWDNIVKMPDQLADVDDFEYFVARTRLGTKLYQRNVIGTFLNILWALLGSGLAMLLVNSNS